MSAIQKSDQSCLQISVVLCILAEFKKFPVFRTVSDIYCANVVSIIFIAAAPASEKFAVYLAAVITMTVSTYMSLHSG